MKNHCTQVVSPPPSSLSNQTLFIAMTLQLPMSLKIAERTISSWDLEDQSPKWNFMRDPIAEAALKKGIMRRICERREKTADNPGKLPLTVYCLSCAPRTAERGSA